MSLPLPTSSDPLQALVERSNLAEIVRYWARLHPERSAVEFLGEDQPPVRLTYGQLDRRADQVAAAIGRVCSPGDRCLLIFPPGLEFVTAFIGCLRAAVVAVPATYPKPRRPNERLTAINQDCRPAAVMSPRAARQHIDLPTVCPALAKLAWVTVDAVDRCSEAEMPVWPSGTDGLAFLQYTSGATSDPKGVMVSHANLLHNLEVIRRGFGQSFCVGADAARRGVFWLPPHHDMGLIGGILTPLYLGGTTVLMAPTSFLKRPGRWLQAISDHCAVISGAPDFGYAHCCRNVSDAQRDRLDLSCWEIAFCGAEPIRAETLRRFADRFGPCGFRMDSFYPCYGLAEATLMVSGNAGRRRPQLRRVDRAQLERQRVVAAGQENSEVQELVGCGAALHGGQLAIVCPQSRRRCQPGEIGEIWCQSPSVARGYWNRQQLSGEVFQAPLVTNNGQEDGGAYLRTGDLGFLQDGQLYITGRLKEVMIVRGRNLFPQDLEGLVEGAHPALQPAGAVAFSTVIDDQEQVVLLLEVQRTGPQPGWNQVIQAVRAAIIEGRQVDPGAIVLVRKLSLPRTTSGKKQRLLCRQLYRDGQLKVVHSWTGATAQGSAGELAEPRPPSGRGADPAAGSHSAAAPDVDQLADELQQWLLQWVIQRGNVPAELVTGDRPLAEFGLDSLTSVELALELEQRLNVQLSPTVVWNYPTAAELSRYLAQQAAGCGRPAPFPDAALAGQRTFVSLLEEIESLPDDP